MRLLPRVAKSTIFAAPPLALLVALTAFGAPGDTVADRVFGQPDFSSNAIGIGSTSLYNPLAVALDGAGRLYVADTPNNRVLEYDTPLTSASATRVFGQAGNFTTNIANSGGISASSLSDPRGVAIDLAGHLFIADNGNNRVLEYDTPLSSQVATRVLGQAGNFTTNAPNNGGVSASSLWNPGSLVIDANGRLYVAETANRRVLEYDSPLTSQNANRVFGQGGSFTTNTCNTGGISADTLCVPTDVAVDGGGHLYVADVGDERVLEYDSPLTSQTATHVFGQGGSFATSDVNHGGLSASSLSNPNGVAVDSAGRLYVADLLNSRVLEYDSPLSSQTANRVFGQPDFTTNSANNGGVSASSLSDPSVATVDGAGRVYVGDSGNNRVLEYDSPLTSQIATRVFGQGGSFTSDTANNGISAASLKVPGELAMDAAGRLYVADSENNRVLEYDAPLSSQTANRVFGQPDFGSGDCNHGGAISANTLCRPIGVALDGGGRLYIGDSSNNRVLEYDAPLVSQTATHVFGQGGSFTTNDINHGGLSASSLNGPYGILVDGSGRLYVADSSNTRVLEYDNPLTIQTANRVFGQGGSFSTATCANPPTPASLCGAPNVATDAAGRLYVADELNNRVLEYDTPLTSQTAGRVFGQAGSFTTGDANHGGLGASSLNLASGVALDGSGRLYVADFGNNRVLEYDNPLTSQAANRVFGQAGSFATNDVNHGGLSASSLNHPCCVFVDSGPNLYIADWANNRVLEYDRPLASPVGGVSEQPDLKALRANADSASSDDRPLAFMLAALGLAAFGAVVTLAMRRQKRTRA